MLSCRPPLHVGGLARGDDVKCRRGDEQTDRMWREDVGVHLLPLSLLSALRYLRINFHQVPMVGATASNPLVLLPLVIATINTCHVRAQLLDAVGTSRIFIMNELISNVDT